MQINNQSIQDMHIFGDPSRIPIIIVERVVNVPRRTTSGNSYFSQLDQKDTPNLLTVPLFNAVNKSSVASPQQNGRVLKIVVFVHGFQVCSLLNVCINLFIYLFVYRKLYRNRVRKKEFVQRKRMKNPRKGICIVNIEERLKKSKGRKPLPSDSQGIRLPKTSRGHEILNKRLLS